MIINNSYSQRNTSFQGSIKLTELYKNYAVEYAKGIKVYDEDWSKLKLFINTIKAVKNDGTTNEFAIETFGSGKNPLWSVRYGNYCKQDEFFNSEIYNNRSYGANKLAEDAFKKIVDFGKEYFGLAALSKPIEEFRPADKFMKRANNFFSKSRQAKDRDSAMKLTEKSKLEEKRAEEAIKEIRSQLLAGF